MHMGESGGAGILTMHGPSSQARAVSKWKWACFCTSCAPHHLCFSFDDLGWMDGGG